MKKTLLFLSAYTFGFGSYLDFQMTVYEQPSKKSAKVAKVSLRDVLFSFVEEKKYVSGNPFFWYKIEKGWVNTAYFNKNKKNSPLYQEGKKRYLQKQMLEKQAQENMQKKSTQKVSDYEKAKLLFASNDYRQAYAAFYKLFKKNMQDPNINFYLGQSAYKLKDFEVAISAYERVLNVDSNSVRSELEIAKCYFELQDYKNSKIIFLKALQENVPPNVKQNIELYLKAIDAKTQKHFFNGSAVVGINYDTNINNRANNDIITDNQALNQLLNTSSIPNPVQSESGFAHQEALSLNYFYKYSEDIKLKNDFVFFAKSLFKTHEKDIGLVQYSPAVSVMYNPKFMVDYGLILNKIWLKSTSLMTNIGINPKLKYLYSSSVVLAPSFQYLKKSTIGIESEVKSLDFTFNKIYSNQLTLSSYAQLYSEKKLTSDAASQLNVSYDYNMYTFALNGTYKIMPTLSISPKFQWQNKAFKKEDPSHLKTQLDNEYQFSLNSIYTYNKKLLFSFDYSYTNHKSNIQLYEFNKQAVTTNVIVLF